MDIYNIDNKLFKKLFLQAYARLNMEKEKINAMNVFPVPDGDTGTNMSLTLKSSVDMLEAKDPKSIKEIAAIVSKGALMGARGNSGVILSQILGGFYKELDDEDKITPKMFLKGLRGSVDYAYKSVMNPVEGTILTVIRESVEALEKTKISNMGFEDFFSKLLYEAKKSLENTPKYLSVLKQAGVVDSGGRGLVSIFSAFYNTIIGKELEYEEEDFDKSFSFEHNVMSVEDIKFAYCTEFIIDGVEDKVDDLKARILELGDSVVFVNDYSLVKIHVHTNNPGIALEEALKYGFLVKVKVDNMKLQNQEFTKKEEKKKNAVISICLGDGFSDIFMDLGVSRVIDGGQTMNPSTEDILKAVDKVNADNIFILPNNSNIFLAANQAKEMSEKNVIVIPTKTIPQGITSMLEFDEDEDVTNLEDAMTSAIDNVDTCQITDAVRNTIVDDVKVKKGNAIAIYNGKLVSSAKKKEVLLEQVILENIDRFELVTIYYGEGIDIRKLEKIVEKLRKECTDADIELYHGGQSVYHYILSFE